LSRHDKIVKVGMQKPCLHGRQAWQLARWPAALLTLSRQQE